MNNMPTFLNGPVLALVLAIGLATPALADKLPRNTDAAPASIIHAATTGDIDFGDDSSEWAKDGECDDPRFEGAGVASELVDADRLKDATDCKAAFEAGTITLKETPPDATTTAPAATTAEIDFGDDSGDWANDGECDDPRFQGTGVASELLDADRLKDATDCKAAFEAGTVTLRNIPDTKTPAATAEIDFGDDTSDWANDGECDDPRFEGTGVASELLDEDLMKDATDCKAAVDAGTATLKQGGAAATSVDAADIDFGDDSSEWANDDECDDPRFEGAGAASEPSNTDILKDATDCRAALEAGTVTLKADAADILKSATEFDFGSDFSRWANDGECDDKRFVGEGMAKKLLPDDVLGDATDCKALVDAGSISVRPVYDPAYAAAAPHDAKGIDFGDNTSSYADDGECDDPRFEGPGAAATLLDSDLKHDRNDCRAAFIAGTIVLL
jgi:hypothetical protein